MVKLLDSTSNQIIGNGDDQPALSLLVSADRCCLIISFGRESLRLCRKAATSCVPCRGPLDRVLRAKEKNEASDSQPKDETRT
jgi:hypothetical protein